MVTVNELKEFMSAFIEIHGQHDNQKLLDSKFHLQYLDGFANSEISDEKEKYKKQYLEYVKIKNEIQLNYGDEQERQRQLDLLKYQLNEIEEAQLKENEDNELEEKRRIFLNSEKISESLNEADVLIGENTIDVLSSGIRAIENIETIDNKYEKISSSLKSLYYEMQEIARDISSYKDNVYFDEEEKVEIEERLDLIYSLKRKYGNNIDEILKYKDEIETEIEHIENSENYIKELNRKLMIYERKMQEIAGIMHNIRTKSGKILSQNINNVLKELEMKNAIINVEVKSTENFTENGKDKVTFYITTNLGEGNKELSKIASGGEMSRVMLAIKKVLADVDNIPVLVFDEIDTGISGKAANSVAKQLLDISKNHQVLCISHLPNIAAVADYNYFISKDVNNNRTNTNVKLLHEKEVIEEIARISAGEINEVAISYATKLRSKKAS